MTEPQNARDDEQLPPVMADLVNALSIARAALDNLTMRVQTAVAYNADLRNRAGETKPRSMSGQASELLAAGSPGRVSHAAPGGRKIFGSSPAAAPDADAGTDTEQEEDDGN